MNEKYNGRVISTNGDFNWPIRSCDLRPLHYFTELREIIRGIGEIDP